MASHKRKTFAKGTVGRFIKKHGLSMYYTQVIPEMICRTQTHEGEKFFILTFRKPGGGLMKIPYSQGSGVKDYPEIVGVLDGLAADILMYQEYQTPRAYCEAFEIDLDDCEEAFKLLEGVNERTLEFLGAEAYNELLAMGQEPGRFEMEGVMGWQRSSTCGL
jgi:hypothetical protein